MTTLVTADWHASANPRDAYRWRFIEETLPAMIAEHGVRRVIVLGDFTEAKDRHASALVNRLVDALAKIAEAAHVYALKGNHDYLAEGEPFFRFLRHVPRVRWINEPTRLTLRGLGPCMLLPHTRDVTADWAAVDPNEPDWFFCHQTFRGARGEGGRELDGPPATMFPRDARVVSGDVHRPQKVGPVTYVGAPYTVDFGDDYEPRVLLLREGRKPQSVPVPGPQKRLVTLSGRYPLAGLDMDHPLSAASPLREGDVVKVRVEVPPRYAASRAEVRARVRAWADKAGLALHAVQVVAPEVISVSPASTKQVSDKELVAAYARRMKKGKAVLAAGLKIMEEVD